MSDVIWVGLGDRKFIGIPTSTRRRDSEGMAVWEAFGQHRFAWVPKKCRNGKVRWLKTLEQHHDGSYTLGRLN